MSRKEVMNRLNFVLWGDDYERFSVNAGPDGCPVITVDLHHKKTSESKKIINNIIKLIMVPFQLDVIHGYNHGTSILCMIRNDFFNPRVRRIEGDPVNNGITHLYVA